MTDEREDYEEYSMQSASTPTPTLTPGWKTSEGWVQALVQLLAIVVGLGLMTKSSADHLGAAASAIGAALAALASAWAGIRYTQARTSLKSLE